jgi:Kef-type K+ transport system membrane component KefB
MLEDASTFLLSPLAMLVAARILAELAARSQIPPVIGELAAGIALGPSLLGWIAPTDAIRLLAEIGIILLLFEVGLQTDVRELARSGAKALIAAAAGVVLPLLLGFGLARCAFGLGLLPALFIGGALTATSIGITVRVLNDLGLQKSEEWQVVLGAAVIDDVVGVILLAALYEFATKAGVDVANVGRVLLFVGIFFVLAPPLAKLFSLVIARFDKVSEFPGLVPTTTVALVLFFAWLMW